MSNSYVIEKDDVADQWGEILIGLNVGHGYGRIVDVKRQLALRSILIVSRHSL